MSRPDTLRVWVDGRLLGGDEPAVSPFDHALLTGDGVFETLKVIGGVPFALTRHLGRLARSAVGIRLSCPGDTTIREAIAETIDANRAAFGPGAEARLRITVTGGPSPFGSERAAIDPTLIVAVSPITAWPPATGVVTVPWPRNERSAVAGLKTVSYAENVVALDEAHRRGAGEAILANLAGKLCEGTGSNVFFVRGGRLCTPPLESGCLAGITRELLIEVTGAVEEDLPIAEFRPGAVDEVFLSSSTRDVQPVDAIDGVPLDGTPGPMTLAARDAFAELVSRTLDP